MEANTTLPTHQQRATLAPLGGGVPDTPLPPTPKLKGFPTMGVEFWGRWCTAPPPPSPPPSSLASGPENGYFKAKLAGSASPGVKKPTPPPRRGVPAMGRQP